MLQPDNAWIIPLAIAAPVIALGAATLVFEVWHRLMNSWNLGEWWHGKR